ncbi:MAG: geranylgeranyl reductase, partial [Chloroflexi bacterium]|nr:geranylgeranyl reductase [Chloroflexota bacterium]
MAPTYDVVVVGGGPAGASAAHVLAQDGARVLLLEKARIPRYKPCGGGITARAHAASPLVAAFPMETTADTVLVHARTMEVACRLPVPIGMVMRDRFDAYLVEQAVHAGAELRDGTALSGLEQDGSSLRLRAGTETITASYVVGADGAAGMTARFAGFDQMRTTGAAVEVELAVSEQALGRYKKKILLDLLAIQGGYAWIFGKAEHLSVGLGVFHR